MTYGPTRSTNASLHEVLTDGKYKKMSPNRGGFVESGNVLARADLSNRHFDDHEKQWKVAPDGVTLPTPGYIPNGEVL